MNVKFLNPFVEAAFYVLEAELGLQAQREELTLLRSACATDEVTVLIRMQGQVAGIVLYGMSESMTLRIVSKILDQPFETLDELAKSGIQELGNVISGQARKRLEDAGFYSKIFPPGLILGKNTLISRNDFDRLVVPITTEVGIMHIHLALRQVEHQLPA